MDGVKALGQHFSNCGAQPHWGHISNTLHISISIVIHNSSVITAMRYQWNNFMVMVGITTTRNCMKELQHQEVWEPLDRVEMITGRDEKNWRKWEKDRTLGQSSPGKSFWTKENADILHCLVDAEPVYKGVMLSWVLAGERLSTYLLVPVLGPLWVCRVFFSFIFFFPSPFISSFPTSLPLSNLFPILYFFFHPGMPQNHSVAKNDLALLSSCLQLPHAGITGMYMTSSWGTRIWTYNFAQVVLSIKCGFIQLIVTVEPLPLSV